MFEQTRALVLNTIKYSDNSSITHFYTEKFGRLSVMIRHSKSKKSVSKKSILQPLFLINIDIQYKQNREVQQCKELVNNPVFQHIPFNIAKSSMAMFLAEFLTKVLKEEEPNQPLFKFLSSSIQLLDQSGAGASNFHIVFLYELSKFLGFYPENNYSEQNCYFNLRDGYYSRFKEAEEVSLGNELSKQLNQVSGFGFQFLEKIKLSGKRRTELLNALISYYRYHLPEIGKIKSLEVLNEVFND
jgi:DNA repair protein RecO (recombination protein O)